MAAATFDIKAAAGWRNQPQTTSVFEHFVDVDFSEIAAGVGLGAGESAEFYTTPRLSSIEAVDAYILTAAGAVCTVDLGDETNAAGWLDGGDANGAAGTRIALAGTEAYRATGSQGKYYATPTGLRLTAVAANAVARLRIVIRGHKVDLT